MSAIGEAVVEIQAKLDPSAEKTIVDSAKSLGEAAGRATEQPIDEAAKKVRSTSDNLHNKIQIQAEDLVTKVGGKMRSGVSTAVSGVSKLVTGGLSTAGALAGAGFATALAKGFSRLTSLDQATAKLQGLGHSSKETSSILQDALKSVKGTAFGLDEAATTAAMVVASGIKPGKDLQKTLTTVADTATIAGMSMGDMGRIFGSVAARGKLQGDDLMQLTSAGVPVLQMLGKSLGVTAAQASEMASKGQISFAMFQKAMEQGVGGAAQSSGKTFTGAMKNLMASLGRIGANIEGGVFPKLAPMFTSITNAMSPLEDKAKALGTALGEKVNPAIDRFTASLKGGLPSLQIAPQVLGPAIGAFAALSVKGITPVLDLIPGLGKLAPMLTKMGGPIGILVSAIVGLVAASPALRGTVIALFQNLVSVFASLAPQVSSLLPALTVVLKLVAGAVRLVLMPISALLGVMGRHPAVVATLIASLTGLVGAYKLVTTAVKVQQAVSTAWLGKAHLARAMTLAWATAQKALKIAMSAVGGPIGLVIIAIAALAAGFAYAYTHSEKFRNGVNAVLNGVKTAAIAVGNWFAGPFANFFVTGWKGATAAFDAVKNFFSSTIPNFFVGIWNGIKGAFKTGIDAVTGFVRSYWPVIITVLLGPLGGLIALVIKNWDGIKAAFQTGVSAVSGVMSSLWSAITNSWAFQALQSIALTFWYAFRALWNVGVKAIQEVWSAMWTGIQAVASVFMGAIRAVISAGMWAVQKIIVPILNGIKSVWSTVWGAIKTATSWVWNGIRATVSTVFGWIRAFINAEIRGIQIIWNAVWSAIRNFVTPIWNGIRNVVSTVFTGIRNTISSIINGIKSIWSAGWNWVSRTGTSIMNGVSRSFSRILGGIKNAFSAAVKAIGGIWNGLKNIVMTPVKWVISKVINNGIISAIRKIQGFLGMPGSKQLKPIPGFRKGGYTGNGPADQAAGVVHRREFVMDEAAVNAAGGPGSMERIRAGLRAGMFPVGRSGENVGPNNQNTVAQMQLPQSFTKVLPGDIKSIIKQGPDKDSKGFGFNGSDAVRWGMARIGSNGWYRRCLAFVNRAWGRRIPRLNVATARIAQNGGPRTMKGTPPPGAAEFWDTGGWAGHVALSVGDGTALSNDIISPGVISRVNSSLFKSKWGAKYMGFWAPDGARAGQGSFLSGVFGSVISFAQEQINKFKKKFSGFADPMGFLKSKFAGFGKAISAHVPGGMGQMLSRIPGHFVGQIVAWAKKQWHSFLNSGADAGDMGGRNGNVESWRKLIMTAMKRTGFGSAKADVDRWLRQVSSESSGNSKAKQGVIDINSGGNEAFGLLQVIPGTFAQYRDKSLPNDRGNPLANAVAAMNYTKARYGSRWRDIIGHGHGYRAGTLAALRGWHMVGENGPEMRWFNGGERVLNSGQTRTAISRLSPISGNGSAGPGSERSGDSFGDINVTLSLSDLDQLHDLQDLLDVLKSARGRARRTMRSGTVTT